MPRLTLLAAGHVSFLTQREWAIIARQLSLSSRELQIVQYAFDDEKEINMAEKLGDRSPIQCIHIWIAFTESLGSAAGLN